jgi:GNAT superfamily N-acetyltransferase
MSIADDQNITVEDAPDRADTDFLSEQIYAYNVAQTGYADGRALAVFARDAAGAIIAGASGFTWGGALFIEYLWVREDLRGSGYGARLLAAAEAEGLRRGATVALLDTHSFQAPAFYQRHGYTIYATAEDLPRGHRKFFLRKSLAPGAVTPDGER